jgi:outer membrane protein, heavy metal efflux system
LQSYHFHKPTGPDFAVEGGWASRGHLRDMWETRVEVRLPLYFWRKQRYAVRESAQAVEQARHEYDATRQALLFRVKDDYLAAKTNEQLMDLYSKTLMPQSTLTLESAMASYQVGKLDFLSLVTNFQSVLGYELDYYEQFERFHEALARLEEATGRQLIH